MNAPEKPRTALDAAVDRELSEKFGVRYYAPDDAAFYESPDDHLYQFKVYKRPGQVSVERGDSLLYVNGDDVAHWIGGVVSLNLTGCKIAVVLRGYTPTERTATLRGRTVLPYVNGCSTRQIFPPERLGDPTLQLLDIPPYSAEQAHHIHSTVRVVLILAGRGRSIVGMEGAQVVTELLPGMVCILDPMCPHHFDTPQGEHLVCAPLHVFSSVGSLEHNHPMWNGTHLVDQGR